MNFQEVIAGQPFILAEGAVIERLRRDPLIALDEHILHAGLIYDPHARVALETIYRQYLDLGQRYALPMITLTPTWRASAARLERAGSALSPEKSAGAPTGPRAAPQDLLGAPKDLLGAVNGDCVRFLSGIVASYGEYARRVYVGGLMGPAGDAYKPQDALSANEAEGYHSFQARALAEAGVDFTIAATLPACSEALGLARAMARFGTPYVLSFVLRPTGALLDGTPLREAVRRIDSAATPRPSCYMANCVHPSVFEQAFERERTLAPELSERVIGLAELETEEPSEFAGAMVRLYERFGIRVLGGCCGTDERHVEQIARRGCSIVMK
jgi:homocysteine S-methyltransferase